MLVGSVNHRDGGLTKTGSGLVQISSKAGSHVPFERAQRAVRPVVQPGSFLALE